MKTELSRDQQHGDRSIVCTAPWDHSPRPLSPKVYSRAGVSVLIPDLPPPRRGLLCSCSSSAGWKSIPAHTASCSLEVSKQNSKGRHLPCPRRPFSAKQTERAGSLHSWLSAPGAHCLHTRPFREGDGRESPGRRLLLACGRTLPGACCPRCRISGPLPGQSPRDPGALCRPG